MTEGTALKQVSNRTKQQTQSLSPVYGDCIKKISYIDFFRSLTGFEPYQYQQKFQSLADKSLIALSAFTGAGKTETIVISWLYEYLILSQAPTRLILQFPLRTLVDQTYRRVQSILKKLPTGHGIKLCQLMGGSVDNTFVTDVSEPTIICGTLDQIVSRQLNRSYGIPATQFPMHFAACNNDCRIFIDETQLQGVAYGTALELQRLRKDLETLGNVELILSSATLDTRLITEILGNQFYSIAVDDNEGAYLTRKRTVPKQIRWTKTKWGDSDFIDKLALEVLGNHRLGDLTLVVLNQVDAAKDLYTALPSAIEKRLIHGRFRGQEKNKN